MDNLCGKKFGRWTVIDRDVSKHNCRGLRWNCICDCGTHIPYTYTTQKIEDLIKSIIEDPVTTTVA